MKISLGNTVYKCIIAPIKMWNLANCGVALLPGGGTGIRFEVLESFNQLVEQQRWLERRDRNAGSTFRALENNFVDNDKEFPGIPELANSSI